MFALLTTVLMLTVAGTAIALTVAGEISSRAPESETNDDINHANSISSDEIVTGDLVISGGGQDVQDWFMFSASRGDVINASVYHLDWDSGDTGRYNINLFLLGPEEEGSNTYTVYWFSALQTRWETASCLVVYSAAYFVVAAANMTQDSQGNPVITTDPVHYTLSVTVSTPPNLNTGGNDQKTLDVNSPNWFAWYKIAAGDEQSFVARLQNPSGTNIDMDMYNIWQRGFDKAAGYQGFQPFLLNRTRVDQKGNLEQMGGRVCDGDVYIRLWLREGGGQYTMNLQTAQIASDGNNRPEQSVLVEGPASIVAHGDQAYDHFDWYKFSLDVGETVDITMTLMESKLHYWNLSVWDSNHNYVDGWFNTQDGGSPYRPTTQQDPGNKISSGGINKQDWTPPAPGTYHVMVMPIASDPDAPQASFPSSQQYRLYLGLPNYGPFLKSPLQDDEIDEDTVFTGLDLSDHFGDPEGDVLTYHLDSKDSNKVKVSTLGLGESNVTITPDPNWFGTVNLTFSATDGAANMGETTVTADMTLTVNPVNDDPYLIVPFGNYSIPEGSKSYDSGRKLNDLFGDIDDATLTYSWTPTNKIIISVNQVTTQVYFTSPDMWYGSEEVTFTAKDSGTNPVTTTSKITVTHMNHIPEYVRESYSIDIEEDDEDDSLNVADMFDDVDLHYIGVDTGEALTYRIKEPYPDNLNVSIDEDDYTLHVRPLANWSGDDDIVIECRDAFGGSNTTKVYITVEPVNDAPDIVTTTPSPDDTITIDEGQTNLFNVVGTDIDNDTTFDLKYRWYVNGERIKDENVKHNQFTFRSSYTSDTGTGFDEGNYIIKVVLTDGLLEDEVEWNLVIVDINQRPEGAVILSPKATDKITQGKTQLVFEAGNATDIDGDELTYIWILKETNETIGEGQVLDYDWGTKVLTPGEHTIELKVTDGETDPLFTTVKIKIDKKKPTGGPGFEMVALVVALTIGIAVLRRRRI
jgi:hypothetical protein